MESFSAKFVQTEEMESLKRELEQLHTEAPSHGTKMPKSGHDDRDHGHDIDTNEANYMPSRIKNEAPDVRSRGRRLCVRNVNHLDGICDAYKPSNFRDANFDNRNN